MLSQPPVYFEHDADVGVIGRGASVEQAFAAAAQRVFAIITDIDAVRPEITVEIEFEEADLEFALVTWINLLLAKAREHGAVFSRFQLRRDGANWHGTAQGEKWRADLERGVEVKGATLTMLSVQRNDGVWEARCVVDV